MVLRHPHPRRRVARVSGPTDTDRAIVWLLRIIVLVMALTQVVGVVLYATRSCPKCPVTPEKP